MSLKEKKDKPEKKIPKADSPKFGSVRVTMGSTTALINDTV